MQLFSNKFQYILYNQAMSMTFCGIALYTCIKQGVIWSQIQLVVNVY